MSDEWIVTSVFRKYGAHYRGTNHTSTMPDRSQCEIYSYSLPIEILLFAKTTVSPLQCTPFREVWDFLACMTLNNWNYVLILFGLVTSNFNCSIIYLHNVCTYNILRRVKLKCAAVFSTRRISCCSSKHDDTQMLLLTKVCHYLYGFDVRLS